MSDGPDGPPLVELPERLDRRLRLGPFPSARDALKFLTYATSGALLAPFVSPYIWLPVVGIGFAVAVWRPEGQAVDERAFAFASWKLRRLRPEGPMTARRANSVARSGFLRLGPGRYAAVLRSGGTPIAYLPPAELARRFDLYRELLRGMDGSFALVSTLVPLRAGTLRPASGATIGADAEARAGYSELVDLLCRRRRARCVYLLVGTDTAGPDSIGNLEGKVASLLERLSSLGLEPVRLRDRGLANAARRLGWSTEAVDA